MLVPAIRCEYRCACFRGMKLIPALASITIAIIVDIVVIPKTAVMNIRPETLCSAAGDIKIGIKGSQGPKMKMINRTHGVTLVVLSPS